MNKLQILKFTASTIASAGTAKIVKDTIANQVRPETKIDKITVAVASVVIAAMAKDKTYAYTSDKIDRVAENIKKLRAQDVDIIPVTQEDFITN